MLKKLFNNRAREAMRKHNEQATAAGMQAREISSIGIHAKVIRADGTVEPERLVSYGHKNPLIHLTLAPLAYLNGAFWNWYYTRKRRLPT
jgi:hypothetical protein